MNADLHEITKRLRLEEKDGKLRFFVDGKFVLEDENRNLRNPWHEIVSCALDYEDSGKTLDGFLDYFEYRKDGGDEEQGRKSFDYCKRLYDGFAAAGVNLYEIFSLVQE